MSQGGKTIYVLYKGKYSDWEEIGYCTTQEEAAAQCGIRTKRGEMYYSEVYYRAVKCLDGRVKYDKPKLYYEYTAIYKRNGGTWECIHHEDYLRYGVMEGTIVKTLPNGAISVNLIAPIKRKSKAKKIAQDKLYEYLASRNMLT